MKPQDLAFIVVLLLLLAKRNPKYFVWLGLACLFISMPLFQRWIFFTAERLVWYASVFLLVATLLLLLKKQKTK